MSGEGYGRPDPEDRVWLNTAQAQDLRKRRLSLAVAVSCGVIATLLTMPAAGLIRADFALLGAALIALTCVVFGIVFGRGWNRRFRDPSMTRAMTLAALFDTTLISCFASDQGRMVLWTMLPGVFVFAACRFGLRRLARLALAGLALLAVGGIAAAMTSTHPDRFRLLFVQLLAVGVSIATLTLVGGRINDLRRRTRSERAMSHTVMDRLEDAVVLVDLNLRVRYCNPGARAMFGPAIDTHPAIDIGQVCRLADGRDLRTLLNDSGRIARSRWIHGRAKPTGSGTNEPPPASPDRVHSDGASDLEGHADRGHASSLGRPHPTCSRLNPEEGAGKLRTLAGPEPLATDVEDFASLRDHVAAFAVTLDTGGDAPRDVELTVSPLNSERGILEGQVLLFRDVTEFRRLVADLHHAATHDEVTGLLNRRGFLESLATMAGSPGESGREACVLAIDLDQFKVINEACGHKAGDELLLRIATMMRSIAPPGTCMARLGGDEFGMGLANCPIGRAEELGRRFVADIARLRFNHGDQFFKVGASVGLVQAAVGVRSAEELLTRADSACFLAKERGRNRLQVYQAGDESVARHRTDLNWVKRINDALDDNRFVLYGQRIERARPDGRLKSSVEALIRMADETAGLVTPGNFLPAAERFDLISAIDRRVISMVAQAMAQGQARGIPLPGVSINLSASSLRDQNLLTWIADSIASSRLPAELFTFELTESAAIMDLEQARRFFVGIRSLGARVALDDVGAGFNSFANLRRLPLDQLKIDGSYVRSICECPIDQAFVESMQRIAGLLGIETVAEFVENASIRERMVRIGIDCLQGYGVHVPEPFMQAIDMRSSADGPSA